MGVDYTGNYGIGCEVVLNDNYFKNNNIDKDDWDTSNFLEYLDDLLDDNNHYSYFEVGSEMYGGNSNEIFLILRNPFKDSYDITEKVKNLREFCENNLLLINGEIDVVGGLLID